MSNKVIHVNKLTDKQKQTFNSRGKTSILIVAYTLLIFLFGLFACVHTPSHWFHISPQIQCVFACLIIIAITPLLFFAIIELSNCCLRHNDNSHKFILISLSLIANLASEIILMIYAYGWSWANDFIRFRNIYICFLLIPWAMLFLYAFLTSIITKEQRFNVMFFPIVLLMINVMFVAIFYLLIIKLFTTFLFLMAITWLTDSFAYLGGSFFGKHKMCPKISPNKTWEGFIISVVLALIVLVALLGLYTLDKDAQYSIFLFYETKTTTFNNGNWWAIVVCLAFGLILCNTFGDLFFSQIKRKNGIKDFSNLLPGHGGILDRVDALTFIICTYTLITFITSVSSDNTLNLLFNGNYPL